MNEPIVRRIESLSIFLSTEDKEEQLKIESEDEEAVSIIFGEQYLGLVDMDDFLGLCERALELWKQEEEASED